MVKRFSRAVLLAGAGLLGFVAVAQAVTPPDVFRDSDGNVYIHGTTASGLAANARATTNEPLSRSVRAGYCGELRLSTSSTLPSIGNSWTINGNTKARANLPVVTDRTLLPRCSGNAFAPTLTAAMTAAGGFIDATTAGTDRVVLLGLNSGVSYPVVLNDVDSSINLRANNCGFYRLGNTASNPLPSGITIGSTAYTVSSLTVAVPPLCQRQDSGSYIRFTPDTW